MFRWNTVKGGYKCRRNARKHPKRARADLFASTVVTRQGYKWTAKIGRVKESGYASSPAGAMCAAEAIVHAYDATTT